MKYYIGIRDPQLGIVRRWFVVQAGSPHHAIARLWQREFRGLRNFTPEQLDRVCWQVYDIDTSYMVHTGRASDAVEIRSAPASLLLDDHLQVCLLRCLKACFQAEEVERFVLEAVEC